MAEIAKDVRIVTGRYNAVGPFGPQTAGFERVSTKVTSNEVDGYTLI